MTNKCIARLRLLRCDDEDQILGWRNSEFVRKMMFNTNPISKEEHRAWFSQVANDRSKTVLIYEEGNLPLGFLSFSERGNYKNLDWGFYTSPDASKGTGHRLCSLGVQYAATKLGCEYIFGQVIKTNERSISLHLRLGFRQVEDKYFKAKNLLMAQSYRCFRLDIKIRE